MAINESAWLNGRELLVGELSEHVAAMRTSMERWSVSTSFRTGLVVFLERRLKHLTDALGTLRHLPSPIAECRRRTLDRMVLAVVGTLRHAEVNAEADAFVHATRNPTMDQDQHPADKPKREPEPEDRPEKSRQSPRRKGVRNPVPAGSESDSDSQADGDVGDGS